MPGFLIQGCILIVDIFVKFAEQWTDCIMNRILKKVEVGKLITTALKSILKLVKLQNLVAKCCKMRKYSPAKFANFVYFCITH